ncbi:hypothetical protein F4808DRAFT_474561 [Astrocystis sublimbata]|nr:hypothetical protein F4808DRAFT_474561 [Astrocystis sublimbata]
MSSPINTPTTPKKTAQEVQMEAHMRVCILCRCLKKHQETTFPSAKPIDWESECVCPMDAKVGYPASKTETSWDSSASSPPEYASDYGSLWVYHPSADVEALLASKIPKIPFFQRAWVRTVGGILWWLFKWGGIIVLNCIFYWALFNNKIPFLHIPPPSPDITDLDYLREWWEWAQWTDEQFQDGR